MKDGLIPGAGRGPITPALGCIHQQLSDDREEPFDAGDL